jgi:phosphatidylcholine synthase
MPSDNEPAAGRAATAITRGLRARAFAVHVFTACGAALALLAMVAAVRGEWALMFLWLGVALIVDGIDGTMARRVRVAEILPRWSGEVLDFVVDFATYVFVPAYAIVTSGLLPDGAATALGAVIVVTSALYFADRDMKTDDNYFRGFPAVWNVVAFYLFMLKPGPWAATAGIIVLAGLTFVPVRFVHPFRVKRWRMLSAVLLALWSALALYTVVRDFAVDVWVMAGLCAVAVYFLGIGALRPAK